jgi:hypothetical protein
MDRQEIEAIVEKALDSLVAEQSALLDLNVTERALSHYLAIYIMRLMHEVDASYDVDVEYNRDHDKTKRLSLIPEKTSTDRELRAVTVYPDIIVHKRNSKRHNLLVLEMKKPGGDPEDFDYDRKKLEAFHTQLHYPHAAHVIIGRDREGCKLKFISD